MDIIGLLKAACLAFCRSTSPTPTFVLVQWLMYVPPLLVLKDINPQGNYSIILNIVIILSVSSHSYLKDAQPTVMDLTLLSVSLVSKGILYWVVFVSHHRTVQHSTLHQASVHNVTALSIWIGTLYQTIKITTQIPTLIVFTFTSSDHNVILVWIIVKLVPPGILNLSYFF